VDNEITIDSIVYTHTNGQWVDKGTNLIPSQAILSKIYRHQYSATDYGSYSKPLLLRLMKEWGQNGYFSKCLDAGLYMWKVCDTKSDENTSRYILPIITSVYRKLGKPQEAISFYTKKAIPRFGKDIDSVASLTSLAAAYCDVQEYEMAKKYCNQAYAKQAGGVGYTNELSMVYNRIKSQTGR